jgi:phage baseplate assembly protein W
MTTYRGFSTRLNAKKYRLTDFELAKQDMLNHFEIRKGEKLMRPEFGSIIWDMLFEPLTEDTKQIITTDITRIVSYDPRLAVQQVAVTEQDNGFLIAIDLAYIPTDQTETISLNFDRANNKVILGRLPTN